MPRGSHGRTRGGLARKLELIPGVCRIVRVLHTREPVRFSPEPPGSRRACETPGARLRSLPHSLHQCLRARLAARLRADRVQAKDGSIVCANWRFNGGAKYATIASSRRRRGDRAFSRGCRYTPLGRMTERAWAGRRCHRHQRRGPLAHTEEAALPYTGAQPRAQSRRLRARLSRGIGR